MGVSRRQYLFNQITAADPTKNTEDILNGDIEETYHQMINSGAFVPNYTTVTAQGKDVSRLAALAATFSSQDLPPTILDLNYAQNMALSGLETFSRAGTDTYTDALGNTQTAAAGVAAFDRQKLGPNTNWLTPMGLKISSGSNTSATLNPTNLLPADFTVVVDAYYDGNAAHNGSIVSINQSGSAATNRVEIGVNSSSQAYFVVQTGGVVQVNQNTGNLQSWTAGFRRLVIAVKSGAFALSDGINTYSVSTGTAPSVVNLTALVIGGSGLFGGWVQRVRVLGNAIPTDAVTKLAAGPSPIATWGDSITACVGASGGPDTYWQGVLTKNRLPWSAIYNGGVGGQTSTQIADRMVADTTRRNWTQIIWAGRNDITNPDIVMANIARMVAVIPHNRFMVATVLNKSDGSEIPGTLAYSQIMEINRRIKLAYPVNYIDIRTLMVQASGGVNDSYSPSWSADAIHPNDTGNAYIGNQFDIFLRSKLWY